MVIVAATGDVEAKHPLTHYLTIQHDTDMNNNFLQKINNDYIENHNILNNKKQKICSLLM